MTMFKKNGGFTLVELIVVIAILAILAGVAIPVYSGYITKAKDVADLAKLDAIKTAAIATQATTGAVNSVYVTEAKVVINGAADGTTGTEIQADDDFEIYYGSEYDVELNCTSAYWNGTEWTITK